jgi:transcriptional regulator with XRE-family HTH domain
MMKLNRKKLREKCLERGWSLYQLSLEAGVDPSHLYRIMSGKRGAGVGTIFKLAHVLGCSPLDLVENDEATDAN